MDANLRNLSKPQLFAITLEGRFQQNALYDTTGKTITAVSRCLSMFLVFSS